MIPLSIVFVIFLAFGSISGQPRSDYNVNFDWEKLTVHPRELLRFNNHGSDQCQAPDIYFIFQRSYFNSFSFNATAKPVLNMAAESLRNCNARISTIEFGTETSVTNRLTDENIVEILEKYELGNYLGPSSQLAPALHSVRDQVRGISHIVQFFSFM